MMHWEKRNEAYVSDIEKDKALDDETFLTVLEDLVERAQTLIDAKREELGEEDDDDEDDDDDADDADDADEESDEGDESA
jgi:hypothetical protein